MAKVLISTIVLRGSLAAAMARAVAISACGLGRLVRMTGTCGGEIGGAAGDLDAGARGRAPARRADVVADDAPAGFAQVPGEGAAHDAKADDADRAFTSSRASHSDFLPHEKQNRACARVSVPS